MRPSAAFCLQRRRRGNFVAARAMATIDLWTAATTEAAAAAQLGRPAGLTEAFVLFVGSKAGGKSTLLNAYLHPSKGES